jgi:hypothetical protein
MTKEMVETLRRARVGRRDLGIKGDGRYCLACGEPLFGPELLHASSLSERPSNIMDAIRYAGTMGGKA